MKSTEHKYRLLYFRYGQDILRRKGVRPACAQRSTQAACVTTTNRPRSFDSRATGICAKVGRCRRTVPVQTVLLLLSTTVYLCVRAVGGHLPVQHWGLFPPGPVEITNLHPMQVYPSQCLCAGHQDINRHQTRRQAQRDCSRSAYSSTATTSGMAPASWPWIVR
jgi:hypothetical protein